jgi:filamentous hemagglutinin
MEATNVVTDLRRLVNTPTPLISTGTRLPPPPKQWGPPVKSSTNAATNAAAASEWSATKTLSASENARAHWIKHGAMFSEFSNASQYVKGAQGFVSKPPLGTLVKTRPNGDMVFYHPATNTFAVKTKTGVPKTMFKPDPAQHGYPTNLDYFNAQK